MCAIGVGNREVDKSGEDFQKTSDNNFPKLMGDIKYKDEGGWQDSKSCHTGHTKKIKESENFETVIRKKIKDIVLSKGQ